MTTRKGGMVTNMATKKKKASKKVVKTKPRPISAVSGAAGGFMTSFDHSKAGN
jgi:hypothetical protein